MGDDPQLVTVNQPAVRTDPGRDASVADAFEIRWRWALIGFVIGFVGMAAVGGLPTDLVANPWFTRMTPPQWYAYPVWLAVATLAGLLVASYVGVRGRSCPRGAGRERYAGIFGSVGGWLAVGCPVCNKLVVAALGTGGALSWFAPVQPWLAALSVLSLLGAVWWRARTLMSCTGKGLSGARLDPGGAPAS